MFNLCKVKNISQNQIIVMGVVLIPNQEYIIPENLRINWQMSDDVISKITTSVIQIGDSVEYISGFSKQIGYLKGSTSSAGEIVFADSEKDINGRLKMAVQNEPHGQTHKAGETDELDVTGLTGILADNQNPVPSKVIEALGPRSNNNPYNHSRFQQTEITALPETQLSLNHSTHSNTNDPSTAEKQALSASVSPSLSNPFITKSKGDLDYSNKTHGHSTLLSQDHYEAITNSQSQANAANPFVTALDRIPGPQGERGPVGPQGPQGIQGLTGAIGPQGPQGPKGDTGAQGIQGIQGIKGDRGESFTVDEHSVVLTEAKIDTIEQDQSISPENVYVIIVSLDSRTNQSVPFEIAGNKSLHCLAYNGSMWSDYGQFTGIKGDKGDQGIQGIQGSVGPIGPQGLQGLQGATGAQGPQGIQGQTGPIGPQGIQGIQGIKGDKGDPGLLSMTHTSGSVSNVSTLEVLGSNIILSSPTLNKAVLDLSNLIKKNTSSVNALKSGSFTSSFFGIEDTIFSSATMPFVPRVAVKLLDFIYSSTAIGSSNQVIEVRLYSEPISNTGTLSISSTATNLDAYFRSNESYVEYNHGHGKLWNYNASNRNIVLMPNRRYAIYVLRYSGTVSLNSTNLKINFEEI